MSNTQPIEEQPEAGQPCATCAGIELIADPDEHWQYRNGEPMAPDAAAFLEYLRGVEQRLVAAEARVAELEAQLAAQSAQGWRDFTERPPIGEPIQIITVIDAVREEPDGLYRIGNTSEWQAWRPAPQEPTP